MQVLVFWFIIPKHQLMLVLVKVFNAIDGRDIN